MDFEKSRDGCGSPSGHGFEIGLVHVTLYMTAGSLSCLGAQGGWGNLGVSSAEEAQED